ncbi:MAG: nucleotidyltransferase domain-containing protein [Nanoarchaeota archaeon]|nr:nucleotidyltransferase domain-containing protein [Nanoarchaeota archaeon]
MKTEKRDNHKKKNKLKNVNIDFLEKTLDKCLAWFYSYPNSKIGLNDLSKLIGSSKTTTKEVVESLIKTEFLKRDIIGKAWLIYSNPRHIYFTTKKIPYNLNLIYESEIINAIYKIVPSPRAIILFGSYRWGSDNEESDIDIAVEVIDNKDLEINLLGTIEKFGYRKNVPVNLHIFSRNKIDLNLYSNIVNGIVLDGILEVKI